MEPQVSIKAVIAQVRSSLNFLTVQGPQNAQILAAACHNLDAILEAISREEEKANDPTKDDKRNL